ncbi:MAG: AMP-binding protein, partial [Gammaproteobacteria bacterium]|nr:AMP-binding protein [Gammaproteobacteria bacterium]
MYPDKYAAKNPERAAFIMASSGQSVSYAEFEMRANRMAHLLCAEGLGQRDHFSIMMENNDRYLEACAAGERTGLYYTCINSYLTADELAYILDNSESQILITSMLKLGVAIDAVAQSNKVRKVLVVDAGANQLPEGFEDYATACQSFPVTPIDNERLGTAMLYSSGTTGRPKGIIRPLPEQPPAEALPIFDFLGQLWHYREDMVYLSPAPLYHSAPQAAVNLTIRQGGTVIIMERFDPEAYLSLIEQYTATHSQLVPTMFSRMLKLPEAVRRSYDLSSLEIAVHAAAPCPVMVKQQMIEWWGPIIHEYYGATEGLGFSACNTEEWLAHPGTVGKIVLGELSVLDDEMQPLPQGSPGTLWFKTATEFEYHNDAEKTAEATSPDGEMTTVGDVGYLDEDGFLF